MPTKRTLHAMYNIQRISCHIHSYQTSPNQDIILGQSRILPSAARRNVIQTNTNRRRTRFTVVSPMSGGPITLSIRFTGSRPFTFRHVITMFTLRYIHVFNRRDLRHLTRLNQIMIFSLRSLPIPFRDEHPKCIIGRQSPPTSHPHYQAFYQYHSTPHISPTYFQRQ